MTSDEYIKQQLSKQGLLKWFKNTQTPEIYDGICDLVEHAYSDGKFHELDKHLAEERERFANEKRHMLKRLGLGGGK